jgi:phosphatidate cytidylyltransferase
VNDPRQAPPTGPSGTRIRLQSGLIAFLILVPILLFGGFWGVMALAVFGVAIGAREFIGMALPTRPFGTMGLAVALAVGVCIAVGLGRFELLAVVLCLSIFVSTLWMLFTARSTEGLADQSARMLIGILYVGALIGFLPLLRSQDGGAGWMWLAFGLGWCGDIGGYFAGRAFGRHKMSPLISPKKTWEGFAGGVMLAVLWASLFKLLFFPSMRVVDCVVLGIIGDAAGVVGDLVESVFKRTYKVKDSGSFLPGHGGILDRVDSVMFAVPVVYLYVALFVPAAG